MKCVITGQSLAVWCRIIHNLSHIADGEIFFDFADTIMTITSANSSVSVVSTFILFKQFFQSYAMKSDQPEKVAIPSKMILKPYRTQKMAKNHDHSEIKFAPDADEIVITSLGKSRVASTYRLAASTTFMELKLDQDPYQYKNLIKVESKVLSSCLANFSHMKGLSELLIKIEGQRVILRNTVTDVSRKDGSVVTEFNFTSHDFLDFEVHEDAIEFAFGFREFKLYATFAEQLKLPVYIHFNAPSDPVFVVVKSDTFEARLCLSTRVEDPFDNLRPNSSTSSSQASTSVTRMSQATNQGSIESVRTGPQTEMIRRRDNLTSSGANNNQSDRHASEMPPAKRARRTEAPGPAIQSQSMLSMDNQEMGLPADDGVDFMDINPPLPPPESMEEETEESAPPAQNNNIGGLVDELEERKKRSKPFIAIQKMFSRPRMTAEEYLKTIPGHDIVLCPDSDEEES